MITEVGPKCSSSKSSWFLTSAQSTTKIVGVTPNPSGLLVPVKSLTPLALLIEEIASINLVAIPLFSSGPTF